MGHPVPKVINMGPVPPSWGLGVGLNPPPPQKNCLLGNLKCGLGSKVWRSSIMEAKARIGLWCNEEVCILGIKLRNVFVAKYFMQDGALFSIIIYNS